MYYLILIFSSGKYRNTDADIISEKYCDPDPAGKYRDNDVDIEKPCDTDTNIFTDIGFENDCLLLCHHGVGL